MKKNPKSQTPKARLPIPVRFSEEDDTKLRDLQSQTGLSLSEIIRRSIRYAGPKFLSGKVNIANFPSVIARS